MSVKTRYAISATLVLLLAGCQAASDREFAAAERELAAVERDLARWRAERRRLEWEPRPAWDGYPGACPVHGSPLRDDVVPIVYGRLEQLPVREFREDPVRLFPLESTSVAGGCCVGTQKTARVKFCPGCRAAQASWMSDVYWPIMKRDFPEAVELIAAESPGTVAD